VRKNPINLWNTEATVLDIHRVHLSSRHHSSCVKLGVVEERGQPKSLSKLRKLHRKPSPIGHPHEDPLFLVKEESGIKLYNDLLVPIVPKLYKICDAMKAASFKNSIESGILLLPQVIKMNPLHGDNGLVLRGKHSAIPILLKECPKSRISAPFLGLVVAQDLTECHDAPWINLVVVDHFSVGVNF
jgi:hypothetical protein